MNTIKVVAAIIKKGDQILIAQRLNGDFAGLWEFPGGKIENHESPQQALKREIQEELGIHVIILNHFSDIEYNYPSFHLSMKCYICLYETGKIILKDHSAYKWMTVDKELKNINWLPADAQIIDKIILDFNKANY